MKLLLLLLLTYTTLLATTPMVDQAKEGAVVKEEAKFIKLRDIPEKSAQLSVVIAKAQKALESQEGIDDIASALEEYTKTLNSLIKSSRNEYLEYVPMRDLRKYERELNINLTQLKSWKRRLEARITLFDNYQKELADYEQLWKNTYKNAKLQKAPPAIVTHVQEAISELDALLEMRKKRYDMLLTNSSTVHTKIIEIQELQKKVSAAISVVSSKLFFQNNLSLADLLEENDFNTAALFSSALHSIEEKTKEALSFYVMQKEHLLLFALITIAISLFVFMFSYLYKKKKLFVNPDSYSKREYFFMMSPLSTAFILIILANTFMFDLSESVKELQLFLLLIPVVRILKLQLPAKSIKYLYSYILLYAMNTLLNNAVTAELDSRFFGIVINILFIMFLVKIIKETIFAFLDRRVIEELIYKLLSLSIILLTIAVGADIYGATLLADHISNGIFILLYASMIFYLLTFILTGYIVILLRRRIASASFPMVEKFTQSVERTATLLIKLFMFAWWFLIVSKTIGVYDLLVAFKNDFMALSWKLGATTISVASLFDFFMIIFGTWFLVRLVNIILQVEIFSRFKFPRGFPTAITTILNYTLVISGTIIALMSLGVTTEQFALVLGALGVGIGFGLRNIIANFISGIIMVFERPIQIGDTIEINNVFGKVQGIGTRSSTVKTFDGSEVIIPNADFIAKDITNWTLSDQHRRKTLTFKVALESDIEKVMEVMRYVAVTHEDVLQTPEPLATFVGFEEYYLEFKLYFWLEDNLIIAPSDIAIGVYKLLKEEGIEMPTPQQRFIQSEER